LGSASLLIGCAILVLFALVAIFAPLLTHYDPEQALSGSPLLPPSREHWFGTDSVNMDVFARVLFAARLDLLIALVSTAAAMAVGVPLGVATGYYAGLRSEVLLRALDVLQAFPVLILATAVVTATHQGVVSIIAVIAVLNTPLFLRTVRGEVLSLRTRPYVEAAQCLPNSDFRILRYHVLPNAMTPVFVQATLSAALSILIATGLAFVGVGITPPTPEWGVMIRAGAEQMISGQWWVSFFPGLAVALIILGFNLLGDGLRQALDPTTW
jgi:peptide/nickel transport system permease protein